MVDAGFVGPVVRISFPYRPTHAECEAMGRAIALGAERRGVRTAFIASGDMSHRLKPGAPSGFDPRAQLFDAAVVRAVEAGDLRAASSVDPALRELAAEDVIDSIDVAIGVAQGRPQAETETRKLLSYEGPFGVGYLVAVLA